LYQRGSAVLQAPLDSELEELEGFEELFEGRKAPKRTK
jgi:hypothetical protein